jgi:DUF4097 and DUF4098 domain-containing protein YvlB
VDVSNVAAAEVKSGSGDVTAHTIAGATRLATGSGNIISTRTGALSAFTGSGDLSVTDVDGNATLEDRSGTVKVSGVRGTLTVKALSGDVVASDIQASADLAVTSGNVTVHRAGGDVRIYAISGDARIECAKGRIEAKNASGNITLVGVTGDTEVETASGDLSFTGVIRADGRYRLKTLSGNATMAVQAAPPGFSVDLTSYSGEMETEFAIELSNPLQRRPVNRKLVGKHRGGGAEIALASFSGNVRLIKAAHDADTTCGEAK